MYKRVYFLFFFFSSRRRHTIFSRDWSSDVCSSDLWLSARRPAPADYTEQWQRRCGHVGRERPSAGRGRRRNQLPAHPRFHHTTAVPSGDRALVLDRRSRISRRKWSAPRTLRGREDPPKRRGNRLGPAAMSKESCALFGNCSREAGGRFRVPGLAPLEERLFQEPPRTSAPRRRLLRVRPFKQLSCGKHRAAGERT